MQTPDSADSKDFSGSTATLDSQFLADVLDGLQAESKSLPCKYLYDEQGSQLFDRICELDEYYLTRTETQIMFEFADSIADCLGAQAVIVEYGSGSSTKTRVLLDHLHSPDAYLPVDISEEHLLSTSRRLQEEYDQLDVRPVVADFTEQFSLPEDINGRRVSVYFPGSTIGNLPAEAALDLLRQIASHCGQDGGLLIGFDLQKPRHILELAYDDPQGVTAEFSLNILRRMNRELEADFDLEQFDHVSFYNEQQGRIEIYLESGCAQDVSIAGKRIEFEAGERIHTEFSHKYTVEQFSRLAAKAGLTQTQLWTDEQSYFALMYLTVA